MRALLLGPNGQLGHDIRRLHAASGAALELAAIGREVLDVSAVADIERVLAPVAFDALINCTSYHKTDEVEDNAGLAFAVNAHAVEAMARVCESKKAKFIHVSTDYVFGADEARDRPLSEGEPTGPVNVYGASKLMGETLAALANEDAVILRVASLFGVAGASGKGGNFVETMIRVGRDKGALQVVQDQVMSPTSTVDIAAVILRMLSGGCPGGIYHVVNTGSASWFEFAREIIGRAGVQATVTPCSSVEYPTRARRPRYSALDNGKVSSLVGSMPRWEEALDRYLRDKGHVAGASARAT